MSRFLSFLIRIMSNDFILKFGVGKLISLIIRLVFSCQASPGVKIGKNVKIGYGGLGCVFHGSAVIGDNVTIGSNVTLGGNFNKGGVPVIEEGAYIATGAKVLGPVKVGKYSVVGANSVVISDVPERVIVAGSPARVIKRIEDV
ncbi:serine acetyltransferase [Vibrio vulnificus]|uniref:serine O-acetyltransferase n=1 Tax=Vibrio vulnificus TaxID=672 RepID=UPI000D3EDF3B|nr:serine acetyltransferase [Vibrio vulnificus]MBN8106888.1 serine acetyltransferase [Vibrio vulnificus]PUZ91970.1 serine acetyltransferase [Vibrio vulnificus]HAS6040074.1 serine acetyltransferase [Vibrio vulnificus]HAS6119841.1 serine acetyltransferase [Vibrio vulnificus]